MYNGHYFIISKEALHFSHHLVKESLSPTIYINVDYKLFTTYQIYTISFIWSHISSFLLQCTYHGTPLFLRCVEITQDRSLTTQNSTVVTMLFVRSQPFTRACRTRVVD